MDDITNTVELAGLIPGAYINFNIMEKLGAYKKRGFTCKFYCKMIVVTRSSNW